MSAQDLYLILSDCLERIENGADIESCLALYPTQAEELRPLLEAAAWARLPAEIAVPADALKRGKNRVLNHAAELREQTSKRAIVFPFFNRQKTNQLNRLVRLSLTSLITLRSLISGGTTLVSASSGALPGDQLYSVKRVWENIRLHFTFNPESRTELENEFEEERRSEIFELFDEDRLERIDFSGVVTEISALAWRIDDVVVKMEDDTDIIGDIKLGDYVHVIGETSDGGFIEAEQITLVKKSEQPVLAPTQIRTPEPQPVSTENNTSVDDSNETETPEVEENDEDSNSGNDSADDDKEDATSKPEDVKDDEDKGEDNSGGEDDDNSNTEPPEPDDD